LMQSAPAKGRPSTSDSTESAEGFGEVYARELDKPAQAEASKELVQDETAAKPQNESAAGLALAEATVIDPLLASLQALAAVQATVPEMPQQASLPAELEGLVDSSPTATLLAAAESSSRSEPVAALASLPDAAPVAGKVLPRLADVSANPARDLPLALPLESGEGRDFADALQTTLAVQPAAPRALEAQSPAARGVEVLPRHVVAEPVGEGRWGEVVAQRVSMMLGRQEQRLEMQLNPPNLGPMEVRLSLGGEQASVVFASQHAAVREALAAATPRLTALLADQGIVLANVQVASDSLNQQHFQQAYQQQDGRQQQGGRSAALGLNDAEVQVRELGAIRVPVARSGVSLYV